MILIGTLQIGNILLPFTKHTWHTDLSSILEDDAVDSSDIVESETSISID